MKLDFIPLDRLSVSKTNMRYAKRAPDVSDILPTVRKRGVIQPVIVRPNCGPGLFEIVAGFRRFTAAEIVAAERIAAGGDSDPQDTMMPCAILDAGDDADAIEASMIENMARLDPDEVTQWVTFTRLVKEGRSVEDIGLTFGLPDLTVRRVLALGNLLPRIRALYADETIDRATVRHRTMATKRQQQDWLALHDDPASHAPRGGNLKAWLLGGSSISTGVALFDLEGSGLGIIADLFGEGACFADASLFWAAQEAVIGDRREAYIEAGWADAVIVPPSDYFQTWEYEKRAKRKGGRVYVDVKATGEVVFHEGYVSRREAARIARGDAGGTAVKTPRPEFTSAMQTYIDLHRHAAVRADLTGHPGVALRMMVAHAIAGSPLWSVRVQPQVVRDEATQESVETSLAETRFDERRRAVLAVLGFDEDAPTVTGGIRGWRADDGAVAVLTRLLDLPHAVVLEVLSIVMGETLASGSAMVEAVGLHIGVDMAKVWTADPAFFDLIRDKEVLTGIVAEVAGATVADANNGEKGKTLKRIVTDHLDGADGRTKVENWVPRWMTFPPAAYTERGGVGTVTTHARAQAAREIEPETAHDGRDEPDPAAPGDMLALPAPDPDDETGSDADPDEERLAA